MTQPLKKDKLIAAGLLAEGWHEDPPANKVRIFRKGELLRCLWTSGIVRDSMQPQGSAKISDEETAMWIAIGEAATYAPEDEIPSADELAWSQR